MTIREPFREGLSTVALPGRRSTCGVRLSHRRRTFTEVGWRVVAIIVELGQAVANELAEGLEGCYTLINEINANARCKLFINLFGIVPTSWGVETCFAKSYNRKNKVHYTYPYCAKT